jgi:hypothetical protein
MYLLIKYYLLLIIFQNIWVKNNEKKNKKIDKITIPINLKYERL